MVTLDFGHWNLEIKRSLLARHNPTECRLASAAGFPAIHLSLETLVNYSSEPRGFQRIQISEFAARNVEFRIGLCYFVERETGPSVPAVACHMTVVPCTVLFLVSEWAWSTHNVEPQPRECFFSSLPFFNVTCTRCAILRDIDDKFLKYCFCFNCESTNQESIFTSAPPQRYDSHTIHSVMPLEFPA
jgi:hypothetical protein